MKKLTDAAIADLATRRSAQAMREAIEIDAQVRAGEYLAALGNASVMEHTFARLHQLLTAIRDIETEKKGGLV